MDAKERIEETELRIKDPEPRGDSLLGQTIADRYQVIKILGSGGMGRVYLVKHLQLDRLFALKLLNKGDFDKRDVDRFNEEAKTASGLHHPNVVAITDYAAHEGAPYLVMEYAEGENLEQILQKGPIPQSVALEIFIQICAGLGYAHSKRVIHRDLKPSNIVVHRQANGKLTARLVDFGIAKSLEPDAKNLTQTGMIVGTPGYMSPEQCTGNKMDARSDVYSLGCVMFEALTGRELFQGNNNMQVIFKHINERPPIFKTVAPEGTEIKPELERIVMQTLEKEPENRYQNCEDLAKDLSLVASGKNPVKEASQARKLTRAAVHTSKLIGVGLVTFLFLSIGLRAVDQYKKAHVPEYVKLANQGIHEKAEGRHNYPAAELYLERSVKSAIEAGQVGDANGVALVLGALYNEDGDPQDAETVLKEAIGRDASLPASDLRGKLHDEYSGTLHMLGKNADAEREAQLSYELKTKQAGGKPDAVTKHALQRLYSAQYAQGKYAEAETTAKKALAELQTFAGNDRHPDYPGAYDNIGRAALRHGEFDAAMQNGMKALGLYGELFGAKGRPAKDAAAWYAHEFEKAGRHEDAQKFLEQSGMTMADADKRYKE